MFGKFEKDKATSQYVLAYLDELLFTPNLAQLIDADEALANKLLDLYYEQIPQQIGKIILESSLTGFSLEKAITLVENVQREYRTSGLAQVRPLLIFTNIWTL